MKKLIIMVTLLSSLMIGCSNDDTTIENENLDKVDKQIDNNTNNDKTDDSMESDYFIEISAIEFQNKVNSDTKNVFFIGRDTCPACRTFKPTAIEFSSKEKINIYYVNTTNATAEDWNIISRIVEVEYIPTIVISDNSKILYNEHGVKSYDVLKSIVNEYINGWY